MKKLRRRAVAVWLRGTDCGDKVATILINFGHILTINTQIKRKIGTGTLLKK